MAILKIARMGHPVLLTPAEPAGEAAEPELRRLVHDMIDTLADSGGVGLAAPQVHVSRRVIIFLVPPGRAGGGGEGGSDGSGVPLTAVLDPEIEPLGEETELDWEGCLSIPDLRGLVPRWSRIRLRGRSLDETPVDIEAEGFHARVIQHEVDHLNGILYPMRMNDLSRLAYNEEWHRYMAPAEPQE